MCVYGIHLCVCGICFSMQLSLLLFLRSNTLNTLKKLVYHFLNVYNIHMFLLQHGTWNSSLNIGCVLYETPFCFLFSMRYKSVLFSTQSNWYMYVLMYVFIYHHVCIDVCIYISLHTHTHTHSDRTLLITRHSLSVVESPPLEPVALSMSMMVSSLFTAKQTAAVVVATATTAPPAIRPLH